MNVEARPAARQTLRVVMVEDSSDDAALILERLRDDYDVIHERVEDAARLREVLVRERWDVLLCDYVMPGFDAPGALAVVRDLALDLPFIIVSGTTGEAAAVAALKAGADDFLRKDDLSRLNLVVERQIRDVRERVERRRHQQQLLLSDRLVSIGTIAAGVAHEINNPLAYVLGNIEYAVEALSQDAMNRGSGIAEALKALQEAREGAERIRVTMRELKVFCRGDDTGVERVDVEAILESAIRMAWAEIRHRARLVRAYRGSLHVEANANRLAQVFLNLLVNAAQALCDGDPGRAEIKVMTLIQDNKAIVEISDTGVGMSPEVQRRLFEPFFTTKPVGIGTGLGLSICRGIVSDLHGEISARSELGKGSVFRVVLPTAAPEPSPKPSLPPTQQSSGLRLLVIDDEPALCVMLTRLLGREHEVVAFTDARAVLERLERDARFDVIVCDVMMPHMSGIEFFDALQVRYPMLVERVMFLTGGAFTAKAADFLSRVSNRRLEKPFEPNALRRMIEKIAARARGTAGSAPSA